ncbi:proline dehydrogenase 1, mitochondrial-like isoform X2 [Amphiura filiformis]|uniref:proline dehydrogenase 1, mitochondrial-like isoform X2 n=1 Tax=Amphiura filiformis TaxID=82378 RepID=UPI003B219940
MAGICRVLTQNLSRNARIVSNLNYPIGMRTKSAAAQPNIVVENEEKDVTSTGGNDHVSSRAKIVVSSPPNIHDIQKLGGHGQPNTIQLEFIDAKEAYRSKTTWEIFRAIVVLRMCQFDALVTYNKEIMKFAQTILGKRLFERIMKASFYSHFIAGENQVRIQPTIDRLSKYGVGAILDYSVEEDISHNKAVEAEMESCISNEANPEEDEGHLKQYKAYPEFGDRRENVSSARTYFYTDEAKCDQNLRTLLQCVDAAGATSTDGFAAVKLTALGRPQMLLNLSEVLIRTRDMLIQMAGTDKNLVNVKLTRQQVQNELEKMGIQSRDSTGEWFTWMDHNNDGWIDLLDWDRLMHPDVTLKKIFTAPRIQKGQLEPLQLVFSEEEERQMKRMLQRTDVLAKRARDKGVRLMIDAEQTYFQPAISRLVIEMMRKFNRKSPVIFNTYQCYLKQAYNNLTVDMELSQREHFHFGAKLKCRHIYGAREARAQEIGYADPINASYEATNQCYHKCLNHMLTSIKRYGDINLMVASHNEDTVRFTMRRMDELSIGPQDQLVYFGQLLGMCDQVSFPLGQSGYAVYKYVPYGPVADVLPYLTRRAQENKGMLKGVGKERNLLWQEFKRRVVQGKLLYNP